MTTGVKNRSLRFADVYKCAESADVLYALLGERDARINISHKRMPTRRQHLTFIRSKPYRAWYLLKRRDGESVGSVYLSKMNEIGLFIFKKYRGRGYGRAALKMLLRRFRPARFLANINPANKESTEFFKKAGFKHIQNTYELRRG